MKVQQKKRQLKNRFVRYECIRKFDQLKCNLIKL